MSDTIDEDTEDLLNTIDQVEETLTVMATVVGHLKEQLMDQLGDGSTLEMSAEEFLQCCENTEGVWH